MKRYIVFAMCLVISHLDAQSLDKELGTLKTALENLQVALSGKPLRTLPLLPEQEAAQLFVSAPIVTRDTFTYQGKVIDAWYGIVKAGKDAGSLGIYLPEVDSGVTPDAFFKNGVLSCPALKNKGTAPYKMFILYDPKSTSAQNASAKKLYQAIKK